MKREHVQEGQLPGDRPKALKFNRQNGITIGLVVILALLPLALGGSTYTMRLLGDLDDLGRRSRSLGPAARLCRSLQPGPDRLLRSRGVRLGDADAERWPEPLVGLAGRRGGRRCGSGASWASQPAARGHLHRSADTRVLRSTRPTAHCGPGYRDRRQARHIAHRALHYCRPHSEWQQPDSLVLFGSGVVRSLPSRLLLRYQLAFRHQFHRAARLRAVRAEPRHLALQGVLAYRRAVRHPDRADGRFLRSLHGSSLPQDPGPGGVHLIS